MAAGILAPARVLSAAMVMHPVGPLPASVYWRRRAVLLLGVVVAVLLLRSCAGGEPERVALPKPTPTPSSAPSPSTAPRPTAAPTPAAGAACADGVIELTATTDAETYPVGSKPKITLTIVNTGPVPCRRDVGGAAVELRVVSGSDRVWSSDDCATGQVAGVELLRPGVAETVVKTWPGTRSSPDCGGTRAEAKNGTYRVVARVGTKQLEGAVFRLTP